MRRPIEKPAKRRPDDNPKSAMAICHTIKKSALARIEWPIFI